MLLMEKSTISTEPFSIAILTYLVEIVDFPMKPGDFP